MKVRFFQSKLLQNTRFYAGYDSENIMKRCITRSYAFELIPESKESAVAKLRPKRAPYNIIVHFKDYEVIKSLDFTEPLVILILSVTDRFFWSSFL